VQCYLDTSIHLALICIPRVVRILEDCKGQLLAIPDEEIRSLRRLNDADVLPESADPGWSALVDRLMPSVSDDATRPQDRDHP
jgi:hypothetical protein